MVNQAEQTGVRFPQGSLLVEAVEGNPNLNVYDKVPGLSPSPYYSFKVREYGSEEWLDTFALLTECTAEKLCNTTPSAFSSLNGWSNTYLNFEMKNGAGGRCYGVLSAQNLEKFQA